MLTKKVEEQIKYQTLDFLQKYLEIEDILNLQIEFVNPVSQPKIRTWADVEAAAREIREKWGLGQGPVPHLIEILEDKGFKVFEVSEFEYFDGLSCVASDIQLPVLAVYRDSDLVRKRFTVAHELGHLLLDFSEAEGQDVEKLCHSFAGALLLPGEVMIKELGRARSKITLWELEKLKGIFGISIQAIMARAKNLHIISETTYKSFCINARKKGWHKKEPGEYVGRERANRFKQLVLHGAAEEVISYSKASVLLDIPLAELDEEVLFVA